MKVIKPLVRTRLNLRRYRSKNVFGFSRVTNYEFVKKMPFLMLQPGFPKILRRTMSPMCPQVSAGQPPREAKNCL